MLVPTDLARFARLCASIGDEAAAGEDGFIAIQQLIDKIGARLVLRPLLVEGMIASMSEIESSPSASNWAVLIDSDTYPIDYAELQNECFGKPLNTRFRNTVAHELVHLLAFRANEFGVPVRDVSALKKNKSALVDEIERETEKLSPLLLWSEKALGKFLDSKVDSLSIKDLLQIQKPLGISRSVLISRLNLIPPSDPLRLKQTKGLRNVAIGVAEWIDNRVASLRRWPLFFNFDRNVVPSFLIQLREQERLSPLLVTDDKTFGMCGGWNDSTTFKCRAGVPEAIDAHSMEIEFSMEWVDRKAGNSFFYVVKKA